ncbi:MAG: RagB/SusD family nutrient uptake outer membrane protein [Cyclobacteriaceae bacterium]|nr:RagB/SusD family nutrient uptake outer membrane protein [Cyclobacteriaceae bacterium]
MKSIKILRGTIIVLFLLFSFSCNDEFLTEEPLSFLSPGKTFVDAAGLQTALETSIKGVFDQWNGDTRELMFNHNMSDASVVSATDKPDAFVDLRTYATPVNDRNNDAGRTLSFYADNYRYIKAANTVIDYIDNPVWPEGANDPERNHLLGTAYFMRAFYYMQLTMQFGNVAFPLNVVTEARRDYKAFHMQGIWDQMISDLEYAVQHVKPKNQLPLGQPPKDAVRILLAKYYMMNLRFSDAEKLMDDVISDGQSRLFTDADIPSGVDSVEVANTLSPFTGERYPGRSGYASADAVNYLHMDRGAQKTSNPEAIWLVVNEPFVLGTQGRAARIRSWGPNFVSTNKGVQAPPNGSLIGTNVQQGTGEKGGKMMQKWGRGQGFARPTNYSQFDIWNYGGMVDEQDYRHKDLNWFEMEDVLYDNPALLKNEATAPFYLQPLRLYHNGKLLCEDTIRCWFGYPRYKFYALNQEDNVQRQDGGKMDMYIMRMAEVYLLRAEARVWQDNYAGAAADLNTIRERANAITMYSAGDIQNMGIGAVLDERCRELYGEEYRHDELVRLSVVFAKSEKIAYNGKTYNITGNDIEKSLSSGSFYYDRMMEKNSFFRDEVPWATYTTTRYTIDPMHIFWPVYQNYIVGNVENVLNQTTGYNGAENNVEPLTHQVQAAGIPNIDPMEAIGARDE